MGLDDTTEPRVVARNLSGDDPTWGQVAGFLDAADAAYSDAASPTQQAVHLAAISQAARAAAPVNQRPAIDPSTRKRGRTAVGATLAALVLLSGGVTAASAFGDLLQPRTQPEPAPMLMDAAPDPAETKNADEGEDADDQAEPKAPGKLQAVRTGTSRKPATRAAVPTANTHPDDHDGDDDHGSEHDDDDSEHESDD